jgi:hypothetical protein
LYTDEDWRELPLEEFIDDLVPPAEVPEVVRVVLEGLRPDFQFIADV